MWQCWSSVFSNWDLFGGEGKLFIRNLEKYSILNSQILFLIILQWFLGHGYLGWLLKFPDWLRCSRRLPHTIWLRNWQRSWLFQDVDETFPYMAETISCKAGFEWSKLLNVYIVYVLQTPTDFLQCRNVFVPTTILWFFVLFNISLNGVQIIKKENSIGRADNLAIETFCVQLLHLMKRLILRMIRLKIQNSIFMIHYQGHWIISIGRDIKE